LASVLDLPSSKAETKQSTKTAKPPLPKAKKPEKPVAQNSMRFSNEEEESEDDETDDDYELSEDETDEDEWQTNPIVAPPRVPKVRARVLDI
jgi:hypothetical protein